MVDGSCLAWSSGSLNMQTAAGAAIVLSRQLSAQANDRAVAGGGLRTYRQRLRGPRSSLVTVPSTPEARTSNCGTETLCCYTAGEAVQHFPLDRIVSPYLGRGLSSGETGLISLPGGSSTIGLWRMLTFGIMRRPFKVLDRLSWRAPVGRPEHHR